ncbi:MAG: hypothetical protein ACREIC_02935 [Limisphaerales bacterium]
MTNLPEGLYTLGVWDSGTRDPGVRRSGTIRVAKLGVQFPCLTPEGRFHFDVVTSFPDKPTVIGRSANVLDWAVVSINIPASLDFVFV